MVHAMVNGSRLRSVDGSIVGNLTNLGAVGGNGESFGRDGVNVDGLVGEGGLVERGGALELDWQVVLHGSPVVERTVGERTQQVPRGDQLAFDGGGAVVGHA